MSPAAVNFAAVCGLSITYGDVVTMMIEEADDNKAASGRTCRIACIGLAVSLLSACGDNSDALTHAERADRAFNAKVTVQVPAKKTAAPEAQAESDSAIQRDKPQATNRDPASTSNSSS